MSVDVCLRVDLGKFVRLDSVQRRESPVLNIRKRPKAVRSLVLSWQRAWVDCARKLLLLHQADVPVWKLQAASSGLRLHFKTMSLQKGLQVGFMYVS